MEKTLTELDIRTASMHPDCPDLRRLGPTAADGYLRARAEAVKADAERRETLWSKGFSRRRLLAGGLGLGVAGLGAQLVTTRVSYAAPPVDPGTGTLVVIFLRGGMDGLSVLVPANDPYLLDERPGIAVQAGSLLPFGSDFGLHPALAPLQTWIDNGRLAAVPAISTPDLSRSHFQAQDALERGAASIGMAPTGWLDRVLTASGPGTTFRAVGIGSLLPRSLSGPNGALAFSQLKDFDLQGWDGVRPQSLDALRTLYTGLDHPLAVQATLALDAVDTAREVVSTSEASPESYPDGGFGSALFEVARLIKSDVGVRVACIDVGGWDMHTSLGTVDGGDMTNLLGDVAKALAAFASDLGDRLDTTTVATMSEFGRRIEQNGSGGVDHGHGGVALILGADVAGGPRGKWQGLAPEVRDQGDVPGTNDYRDLFGELVGARLGVTGAALADVFPGHTVTPIGVLE